jgi:hypothetical protein
VDVLLASDKAPHRVCVHLFDLYQPFFFLAFNSSRQEAAATAALVVTPAAFVRKVDSILFTILFLFLPLLLHLTFHFYHLLYTL